MIRRSIVTVALSLAAGVASSRIVSTQAPAPASSSQPAVAESDIETLKRQVQQLVAGQEAMRRQLEEIRNMLRVPEIAQVRRAPAPITSIDVVVGTAGAPARGPAAAKLTVVEFTDFECPFCGDFARQTLAAIDRDYIQPGRVRYVVRNFPLEQIHPHAFKAGVAAMCSAEQGKYWEMHDRLFANQKALESDALTGYGRAVGLDAPAYESCLASQTPVARIRQDQADGQRAGVSSTPTFLIGFPAPDDPSKIHATRIIRGAQPYVAFKTELDRLLKAE